MNELFTAILSPSIPKLVQSLCQKVYEYEVMYGEKDDIDISKTFNQKSVAPFRFHIPRTGRSDPIDPIDAIDEECELLENARFLTEEAIRLCTAHMISTLRTRRNQYNSTYRLPNEVLSLIFQFTECSSGNPLRPLRTRAPLNVAAVSRLWREVALNTPSLWTRIDVMAPWLMRIFLKRSKEVPLRIEIDGDKLDKLSSWAFAEFTWFACDTDKEGSKEEDEDARMHEDGSGEEDAHNSESDYGRAAPAPSRFSRLIGFLKPAAHRWASVELRGVLAAEDLQTLCFPLSSLESLRMNCSDTGLAYKLGTGTVFHATAPHLRDLHLAGVPIPFTSPIYTGLTNLHLEHMRHTTSTISQFLSILAACPDLESLILIKTYFHHLELAENSALSIPIKLDRLQRLQLNRVDGHLVRVVLNSISAPSSVILDLGMEVSSWAEVLMPTNMANAPLVRHMLISSNYASSEVPAYAITGKASEEGPTILEIRYFTYPSFIGSHTPDFLRYLGQGNAFSSLEFLTFNQWDVHYQSNASAFAEMLGNLASLKVLTLGWCPSTYLDALIVSPHHNVCPRLQTLRLRRVEFDETLLKLVESRARDRGNLESLELAGYFKYPCVSIIAALKGLVAVSENPVLY